MVDLNAQLYFGNTENYCERRISSSQLRAGFRSHMGLSKNVTSRELLIFLDMAYRKKIIFLLDHNIIDILAEPAQPHRDQK